MPRKGAAPGHPKVRLFGGVVHILGLSIRVCGQVRHGKLFALPVIHLAALLYLRHKRQWSISVDGSLLVNRA